MRKPTIFMLIASLLNLLGCNKKKELASGEYLGTQYVVQSVEHQNFIASHFTYEVKLGNLPKVPINAHTTNWGPPYSPEVFGSTPLAYNGVPYPAYTDSLNLGKPCYTLLYLDPDQFNDEVFAKYVAFFKKEWPALDPKVAGEAFNDFPHLIGLVHGTPKQFTKQFSGEAFGQKMVITVTPDGRVSFGTADGSSEQSSGLANMVQMPGRHVPLVRATWAIGPEVLAQFKDKDGKTLSDYFDVPLVAE
jgi:hypothetical protein